MSWRRSPPDGKRLFFRLRITLSFRARCCHSAVGAKHVQILPLAQGVVDGLSHGMLWQQLFFPEKKLLAYLRQYWSRLSLAMRETLIGSDVIQHADHTD